MMGVEGDTNIGDIVNEIKDLKNKIKDLEYMIKELEYKTGDLGERIESVETYKEDLSKYRSLRIGEL